MRGRVLCLLGQAEPRARASVQACVRSGRGSSIWTNFCSLPRSISRKLNPKKVSQDLNSRVLQRGMLMVQAPAQPFVLFFGFFRNVLFAFGFLWFE